MGNIWEIITFIPRLVLTIITLPLRLVGIDIDLGMGMF